MRENDYPTGWWNPDPDEELMDDYFDDNEYDPPDDEEFFDCGFDPDLGRCHHAGSEGCQFRCPYHDIYHQDKYIEGTLTELPY